MCVSGRLKCGLVRWTGYVCQYEFTISPVHKLITFKLLLPVSKVTKKIYFRNKVGFSAVTFISKISQNFNEDTAGECVHNDLLIKSNCVNRLTNIYNQVIKTKYNNVCPMLEKVINVKDRSPWFYGEILTLKREKRRKECKCRNERSVVAWEDYKNARNHYNDLISRSKRNYYHTVLKFVKQDPI